MYEYDNGLDAQHLPGVLQDEADASQAHHEEERCQDARHNSPWQREWRQFLEKSRKNSIISDY